MQRAWKVHLCLVVISVIAPALHGQPLAFDEAIDHLAQNLAGRIEAAGMDTVAVIDFTDVRGERTELGRFLAEELSVALLASPREFRVVDRAHLSRILEEMKLGESGIIDPDTAKEVGRIAGVNALITGTLTPLETTVRLTVKVLQTETANIIAGDRVSVTATGPTRELLARGLVQNQTSSSESAAAVVHKKAYNMAAREAGGLRATVRSMRILTRGRVASLIDLQNNNPYPVRVGIPGHDYKLSKTVDNNGNLLTQDTGLEGNFDCENDQGLTIQPGGSQQITTIYEESKDLEIGSVFQLSLTLRICKPQDKDWKDGFQVEFSFSDLAAERPPSSDR